MNTRNYVTTTTPAGTRVARFIPGATSRDDVYMGTVIDVFGSMVAVHYDGAGTSTGPIAFKQWFIVEDESTPEAESTPEDDAMPAWTAGYAFSLGVTDTRACESRGEHVSSTRHTRAVCPVARRDAAWSHDYESPRGEATPSAPCAACGAPYGEWVHQGSQA